MKLPRDVAAADLEKALRRAFGYEFTRQSGSHRRLTTQTGGEHHLTIPVHDPVPLSLPPRSAPAARDCARGEGGTAAVTVAAAGSRGRRRGGAE
ncbi:MAG TPA: type II toxin-antitoxin system HicA family toxin [Verrucomicrobiota bacterium]|nr:type II toxin-antitoxin system HicA family toxin [Verrucomicrobiota bacterium]HNU52871.1 type II toxin-antitoxin system HicA family toxin [Verrucomicrobiota bacterium]